MFLILAWPIVTTAQSGLSPALLYPNEGDTLTTFYPTFSWSTAYAPADGQPPTYEIKIVEILGNQSPEAAIQANPDWYSQSNIPVNVFAYPISVPSLKQHKRYAWQVSMQYKAVVGEAFIPRTIPSEVFWFGFSPIKESKCLTLLQERKAEHLYVIENGELIFRFEPAAHALANEMVYHITTLTGENMTSQPVIPEKMEDGKYYLIPLRKFEAFRKRIKKNTFYLLTATHSQGQVYSAQFTSK